MKIIRNATLGISDRTTCWSYKTGFSCATFGFCFSQFVNNSIVSIFGSARSNCSSAWIQAGDLSSCP